MNKKRAAWLVAALMTANGISGGVLAAGAQLDEVIVTADRYDADTAQLAPVASGMVGTKQNVGTLGSQDVLDTPFEQMTFTKKAMETFSQPQRSVMDVLSLSPSVRVTHGSTDTNLYIRGFSAGSGSWSMNGIPSMSHQMTMPTNYMDRVEVLAGPNIGVNGIGIFMAGSVGGTVGVTTKKAQEKPMLNAGLSWSSDSYYTQTVDVGKRFGKDGAWGVRINALNATGGLAVDGTRDYKRDIAVNIDHRAERSKTNIFFSYDYDNQYGRSNTIGLGSLSGLPKVPSNKKNLSPHWSNDKYENTTFILNHEQYLSDDLTWFGNFGWRWEDYSSWLQQWSGRQLIDFDGNYKGTYTQMPVFHHYTYANTGFKGKFNVGQWKNEWAAMFDWTKFTREKDTNVSAANKYDITGNIYSGTSSARPNVVWDAINPSQSDIMSGWTLVNTLSSPDDRLHFTFGYHGHEVKEDDQKGHVVKSSATAPILGLNYKITPNVAVYASHTENFVQGNTVGQSYSNRNEILPPSKTKQNEFGFKYKNGDTLSTLSFFEIKKANGIAVPNGDGTEAYKLDGEQRNRGIEYSVSGDAGRKLSYIAGISYLDSKQTKTKYGLNDGRRVDAMPKWSADLALMYKPTDALQVTGRLTYTGAALIRNTNSYDGKGGSISIGGQTLVDLGVSWDTHFGKQPVTLSAWCYNLFDKDYWYAAGGNNIGLGAPRTYAISAQFKF